MFNFPGASGGFRGSCSSHNNRSPTLGHRRQKELCDTSRQDVAKIRLVITSQGVCWAATATRPVIPSSSGRQLDGNCNEQVLLWRLLMSFVFLSVPATCVLKSSIFNSAEKRTEECKVTSRVKNPPKDLRSHT